MTTLNIDSCKSYRDERRLPNALTSLDIADLRHVVVRNRDGRWTAIFTLNQRNGQDLLPAHLGFLVLG